MFFKNDIYSIYKIKKFIYSKKKIKNTKSLRVKFEILFVSRLKVIERNIIGFFSIYLFYFLSS